MQLTLVGQNTSPGGQQETGRWCTYTLKEAPLEFRELVEIQLHRLRYWQLYVVFSSLDCRERQLEGIKSNVF